MISTPGSILTLGLGGSPSLMVTLGYGLGAYVPPPADTGASGGWWPSVRRRSRAEIDEERRLLGILPPKVLEAVAEAPKARRRVKLAQLIGKPAAARISAVDLSDAIALSKRRKRQREDEMLLLM